MSRIVLFIVSVRMSVCLFFANLTLSLSLSLSTSDSLSPFLSRSLLLTHSLPLPPSVRWVMAVDHASSSLLLELEDEHGEALVVTADGNDRAADRGRGQSTAKRGVEYVSTSISDNNEEDAESSSRRRKIR